MERIHTKKRKVHSEKMHPNSRRLNTTIKKISPHMLRKKDEVKTQVGGFDVFGFFQTFKMRRQLKTALKDASKIKSASRDIDTLSSEYTRSILRYEGEINNALSLANEFINRFREKTILVIIAKNYKTSDERTTSIDAIKSHPRDQALERMKQIDIEISQLSTELKAIDAMMAKQQKKLKEIQVKYEKKTSNYFDVIKAFAEKSAGTYQTFYQKKEYIGKLRGKLESFTEKGEKAKVMREIKKFETIESLVDELLEKNKKYRDSAAQKLLQAQEKRSDIRYLDKQFVKISETKNNFIKTRGNNLHKTLEEMFKLLLDISRGQRNIQRALAASDDGIQNVFNKLSLEKREYIKYLLDTIRSVKDDMGDYVKLEKEINAIGEKTINHFFEQKPAITFKVNFNGIIEGRNKLLESLTILAEGIKVLIFTLSFISKKEKNTVTAYLQWLLDNRFKSPKATVVIPPTPVPTPVQQQGQQQGQQGQQGQQQGQYRQQGQQQGQYRQQGQQQGQQEQQRFRPNKPNGFRDGPKQFGGALDDKSRKILDSVLTIINNLDVTQEKDSICNVRLVPVTTNGTTDDLNYDYTYQLYDKGAMYESSKDNIKYPMAAAYADKYISIINDNIGDDTRKTKINGTEYQVLIQKDPDNKQVLRCTNYHNNIFNEIGLTQSPQHILPKVATPMAYYAANIMKVPNASVRDKKNLTPSYEPYLCPFTKNKILPNSTYLIKKNLVNMATGIEFEDSFSYNGATLAKTYGFSESLIQKIINGNIGDVNGINLFPKVLPSKKVSTPYFTNRSVADIAILHALIGSVSDTPMATKPYSAVQFANELDEFKLFHIDLYSPLDKISETGVDLIKSLDFVPNAYLSKLALGEYLKGTHDNNAIKTVLKQMYPHFKNQEEIHVQIIDRNGEQNYIHERTLSKFFLNAYNGTVGVDGLAQLVISDVDKNDVNRYDYFYDERNYQNNYQNIRHLCRSVYSEDKVPLRTEYTIFNTFMENHFNVNNNDNDHTNNSIFITKNMNNRFRSTLNNESIQDHVIYFDNMIHALNDQLNDPIKTTIVDLNKKLLTLNKNDPKTLFELIKSKEYKNSLQNPTVYDVDEKINQLITNINDIFTNVKGSNNSDNYMGGGTENIDSNNNLDNNNDNNNDSDEGSENHSSDTFTFETINQLLGVAVMYEIITKKNSNNNVSFNLMRFMTHINASTPAYILNNISVKSDIIFIFWNIAKCMIDVINKFNNNELWDAPLVSYYDTIDGRLKNTNDAETKLKSLFDFGIGIAHNSYGYYNNNNEANRYYETYYANIFASNFKFNHTDFNNSYYIFSDNIIDKVYANRDNLINLITSKMAVWQTIHNLSSEILKDIVLKENIKLYRAIEYESKKKNIKNGIKGHLHIKELLPIPRTVYFSYPVKTYSDNNITYITNNNNAFRFDAVFVDEFTLKSQLHSFAFSNKPPIILAGLEYDKLKYASYQNRMNSYFFSIERNSNNKLHTSYLTLVKSDLNNGNYSLGGRPGVFNSDNILFPIKQVHGNKGNWQLSKALNINITPKLLCTLNNANGICAFPVIYPNTVMFKNTENKNVNQIDCVKHTLQIVNIQNIHNRANEFLHHTVFNGEFDTGQKDTSFNNVTDVNQYKYTNLTYDYLNRGCTETLTTNITSRSDWFKKYNKFNYLVGTNKYHVSPDEWTDITIKSHSYQQKAYFVHSNEKTLYNDRDYENIYANGNYNRIIAGGFEEFVPIYRAYANPKFAFFNSRNEPNGYFKFEDKDYPIVHDFKDYKKWLNNTGETYMLYDNAITDNGVKELLQIGLNKTSNKNSFVSLKDIYSNLVQNNTVNIAKKFLGIELWGNEYTTHMENVYCDINMHPIILQPYLDDSEIMFQNVQGQNQFMTYNKMIEKNQIAGLHLHENGNPYVNRDHIILENIFDFDTYITDNILFYEATNSSIRGYPKSPEDYDKTHKMYITNSVNIRHHLLPTLLDDHYYYLCKGYNYHIDNLDKFLNGFDLFTKQEGLIEKDTKTYLKYVIDALDFKIYNDLINEMNADGNDVNVKLQYDRIKPVFLYQYLFGAIRFVKKFISIISDHPALQRRIQFIRNNYLKKEEKKVGGALSNDIITGHLTVQPKSFSGIDMSAHVVIFNQYNKELQNFLEKVVTRDIGISEITNIVRKPVIDALTQWLNFIPDADKIDDAVVTAGSDSADVAYDLETTKGQVEMPKGLAERADKIIERDDFRKLRMANSLEQMISLIVDPNKPLAYEDMQIAAKVSLELLEKQVLKPLTDAIELIAKTKDKFKQWNITVENVVHAEDNVRAIGLDRKDPKFMKLSLEEQSKLAFKEKPDDLDTDVSALRSSLEKDSFDRNKIAKPLSVGDKNLTRFTSVPMEVQETLPTGSIASSSLGMFDRAIATKPMDDASGHTAFSKLTLWASTPLPGTGQYPNITNLLNNPEFMQLLASKFAFDNIYPRLHDQNNIIMKLACRHGTPIDDINKLFDTIAAAKPENKPVIDMARGMCISASKKKENNGKGKGKGNKQGNRGGRHGH